MGGNKFSCPWNTSWTPQVWLLAEHQSLVAQMKNKFCRRFGIVLRNVSGLSVKI